MEGPRDIEICVQERNALEYPADALVLKYAQQPAGVDAKAKNLTGIDLDRLPPPGEYRVVRDPPGLRAHVLVFLGVIRLREFGYREIREFSHRALSTAAADVPDAHEVALTIHGVGYGLDELESFDSELAGILDAIREGDVPRTLERVSILEINPGRARRMTERLSATLRNEATVPRGASAVQAVGPSSAERLRTVGYESSERGHAFVAMPFAESFEDVFHFGISSAVHESGLLCERIDEQVFTGDILDRLMKQIRTAQLVVADLTDANPNVYLEVGYSWGCRRPTVLVCHKDADLKFDVRGHKCLHYTTIKDLQQQLTRELTELVAS